MNYSSLLLSTRMIRHHPHLELWYRHGDLSAPLLFSKGRITASEEKQHMCNPGHINWDQKIITFAALKPVHILRSHRSHGVYRKGQDFFASL